LIIKDVPTVEFCETGLRYKVEKAWPDAALTGEYCTSDKTSRRRHIARTQSGFKNQMLLSYY